MGDVTTLNRFWKLLATREVGGWCGGRSTVLLPTVSRRLNKAEPPLKERCRSLPRRCTVQYSTALQPPEILWALR